MIINGNYERNSKRSQSPLAVFLMGGGWYSLGYGFTSTNGDGNFSFIHKLKMANCKG